MTDQSQEPIKVVSWRDLCIGFLLALVFILLSYLIPTIVCSLHSNCEHLSVDFSEVAQHIFRDLGIALLIGILIILVLEARHRKEIRNDLNFQIRRLEEKFQAYKDSIGQSFLYAIFARRHPPEVLDTVKQTIFEKHLLRENVKIELRLHDFESNYIESTAFPDDIRKKLLSFKDTIDTYSFLKEEFLLVMKLRWSFDIRNISDDDKPFPATFFMQIPFHPSLEALCEVYSITVGGEQRLSDFDRIAESGELRYYLKQDKNIVIRKGDSIRIEYCALSVRWRDDNEPFSMVLPSKGLVADAEDGNGNKEITIIPRFATSGPTFITKDTKTHSAHLETKECLLPYQGIVIRWRPYREIIHTATTR